MQINRLFEMVYILLDEKTTTAKKLSEHFEVSTRTILRDIEILSAAGIPIYTTRGKGGGISILGNYVLNKALVSEEEQNQIIFALQSLPATQYIETKTVLNKFQRLFEKTNADWIQVDFSRWGKAGSDKKKFQALKNAVIHQQALLFTYSNSYGETSARKVYPLKLAFKSKSWYLQAYCLPKKNYRTFKINRMRDIIALPETFNAMEFQTPEIESSDEMPQNLIKVVLKVSPHMAYRIYDEFEEQDITTKEDGSFIVTMCLPSNDWLFDYVLSFGASIEVLQPQSVRDAIFQRAEDIKRIYSGKT